MQIIRKIEHVRARHELTKKWSDPPLSAFGSAGNLLSGVEAMVGGKDTHRSVHAELANNRNVPFPLRIMPRPFHSTGRNNPTTEVTIQMTTAMSSALNQPIV